MEGLKNIFFYILKTFQRRSFFGSSIFKMGKPRSLLFLSFLGTAQKNWVASRIRTQIIRVEGFHKNIILLKGPIPASF